MEEWGYSPTNSNCEVGILGCERQQQRRAFDRPLQLLVQLCFGLRRGNLENFAEAIPASINEQLIKNISEFLILSTFYTIYLNEMEEWGYSPTRDDNISAQLLVQSCFEFRRVRIAVLPVHVLHKFKLRSGDTRMRETTTKTGLRPTLTVTSSVNEMEEWGYSPTRDDNISAQLLVQSCFEFRRVRIAVLPVHVLHKFKLRNGDTRMRETTTKTGLRPTLTVTSSVNEMEEWGYSPTRDDNISAQLLVQSCFEFRRVRIAVLPIQIAKWGYSDTIENNKDGPSTDPYSY
ncbi:LOW QUALITY PROTEIN: uncharacterized protein V1477_003243 [Vespula maculifrons]|uniref:Uncharacterized protein n=1 Tax=Vespula maculifrons TaxID=7453 RepID=A0ABD2CVB8_VESMC